MSVVMSSMASAAGCGLGSLGSGGGGGGREVLGGGDGFIRKLVALQMASSDILEAEIRASTSVEGLPVRWWSRMEAKEEGDREASIGLRNFLGSLAGLGLSGCSWGRSEAMASPDLDRRTLALFLEKCLGASLTGWRLVEMSGGGWGE